MSLGPSQKKLLRVNVVGGDILGRLWEHRSSFQNRP
jgi:hypothetical protein